jgi:hypothetical protein
VLTTPIDAYLPLVIALLVVCAWLSRGTRWSAAVQCAVPLLIVVMMTIPHERTRLLAYGVVVAAAVGFTAASIEHASSPERRRPAGWLGGVPPPMVVLVVIGVVMLRWIPSHDVHIIKELILMAGSIVLLVALWWREAGGTLAFLSVLFLAVVTPIPPGKMALLPLVVAALVLVTRRIPSAAMAALFFLCAYFARYSLATIYIAIGIVFLVPLLDRVRPLAYATALVVFALWPWSGIIARALPVVRNYRPSCANRQPVVSALAAAEALPIGVPPHTRSVIVTASGGQMARFKPGRVVGTIEATLRAIAPRLRAIETTALVRPPPRRGRQNVRAPNPSAADIIFS